MTPEQLNNLEKVLLEHEYSFKEGNKVFCQSCGKEHRDSTKPYYRAHRPHCAFVAAVLAVRGARK